MKATRRALEAKAAEMGATIEEIDDAINVVAPYGFVWSEGHVISLCALTEWDGKRDSAGAYADALERMAYGLEEDADEWTEPCSVDSCECPR